MSFNGARWLPGCLESLAEQDYPHFELIIHDNASRDSGPARLREWAAREPNTRLSLLQSNVGYAVAHNRAIAVARGEFVLLLNQDVELHPKFLSEVVAAFVAHPEAGSVQPRLRQLSETGLRLATLDTTGLMMARDRRAYSRAQGQLDGEAHDTAGPVWGADGPAPTYRLSALRQARLPRGGGAWEVLDEDFFLYKEDVDLAWRLRLLGWSTWYEPAALGWHARGTGGTGSTSILDIARTNRRVSSGVRRLSWRNQRLMQIKNDDVLDYFRDLPWIARREILSLLFILLHDPGQFRAIPELVRLAPSAMRKRQALWSRVSRSQRG